MPSGQFAGLDQACVDTLLDIDPNAAPNLVQLTCRPENIDDDDLVPDDIPIAGNPVEPLPVDTPPIVSQPIETPIGTPPGLNIAPADVAGGNYYQNSRVSALLSGPSFGTGTRPNTELVKPLTVRIDSVEPGLSLIEMRASRDTNGGNEADFMAVVQNTSNDFHCSVTLSDFTEFSVSGQEIVTDSLDFAILDGEIGARPGDDFYSPSCLQPGNLGYILSFRDASFDDVAEVRSPLLRSSTNREQVAGAVLPVSYGVNNEGSVSITIVNNHSEALDVFKVTAIAIDDQGHAFSWEFEVPLRVLAPGEELIVDNFFNRFQGRASSIRAIVDFDLPQ